MKVSDALFMDILVVLHISGDITTRLVAIATLTNICMSSRLTGEPVTPQLAQLERHSCSSDVTLGVCCHSQGWKWL